MVYDLNGNELVTAYDVIGNELASVYEINETEHTFAEPILFSDVPDWYKTDIQNAVTYLNNLGDGYVNYIVMADTHYGDAYPNAPKIFNYLYQECRIDKMVHLGDMLANSGLGSANWNALIDADFFHFKKWLFAQGNHDTSLSADLAEALTYFETTKNIRYTASSYHNLFYYDNDQYKIRFIGAHFYHHMDDKYTLERYIVTAIGKGYKWIFMNHFPMGYFEEDDENMLWLKSMIETYGNFICSINGHWHADNFTQKTSGTKTFWEFNFDADISGIRETYGENSDQAVSILSINPTTEDMKIYRIGRSRKYEGKQWSFNGFVN